MNNENELRLGLDIGVTTRVGVQASWVIIFYRNQNCPPSARISDEAITEWMNREFPLRKSKVYERVGSVRSEFNRLGGYEAKWINALREASLSEFVSERYDDFGNVI